MGAIFTSAFPDPACASVAKVLLLLLLGTEITARTANRGALKEAADELLTRLAIWPTTDKNLLIRAI